MTDFWQQPSKYLKRLQPKNFKLSSFPKEWSAWLSRKSSQWLDVDDQQIAEILERLRTEIPTTEALLIGKPQAGKSSIVRGLTGVSEDIVGQGFRPHTQYTEQYAYPSTDLPLLIFTDTVGLGDAAQSDVAQNMDDLIKALVGEWQGSDRARVLIVTVKINDFAVAALNEIVEQMRLRYPSIPCLLAVTCVHEVYPTDIENHPDYPPHLADVNRAFEALKDAFEGLWDQAILIDFTLEEDGYTPVFYGLEALRDTLAELLPEAEARTIRQLLDGDASKQANEQLGSVYREVGRRYMLAFSTLAATLAAVPLPFATMPVLTTLQVSMVGVLGKLYGQKISTSQAGGIVSAIAGGFLAQAIGRELIKFIPGFGSVVAASWAAAYTWALGEGACVYFGDLMGGKKPDPDRIQQAMNDAFEIAKQRFKQH